MLKKSIFPISLLFIAFPLFPQNTSRDESRDENSKAATCEFVWNFYTTVSGGIGGGAVGWYNVEINIYTHKRSNLSANDGGHHDWFCAIPDIPWNQCPSGLMIWIDGVYLVPEQAVGYTGIVPDTRSIGAIEGPFNKLSPNYQWEWPSGGSIIPTYRETKLLEAKYSNFYWDGSIPQSDLRVQWYEDDPYLWDDHSCFYTFEVGDLIQLALQQPYRNTEVTILPQKSYRYFVIASEDCCHFNIQNWFYVTAKVTQSSAPGHPAPPTISGSLSNGHPQLTWSAIPGASGYRIYRRFDNSSGTYSQIATTSSHNYVDTSQTTYSGNGTKRYVYYKVSAYNSIGESSLSNYRQFTVEQPDF